MSNEETDHPQSGSGQPEDQAPQEAEKSSDTSATPAEGAAESPSASPAAESPAAAGPGAGGAGAGEGREEARASTEEPVRKEEGDRRRDIFLELDPTQAEAPKIIRAKGSKNVHSGIVFVQATFNNTIVSVTDRQGNILGWSSAGKMGFRGSRKSTAYAAQLVSQDACRQAMGHGLREAEVRVKGPGSGRESAVRAVQAIGIEITVIRDVTPIPHNVIDHGEIQRSQTKSQPPLRRAYFRSI
jgi:small subunit ribosomal protein S11